MNNQRELRLKQTSYMMGIHNDKLKQVTGS